MATIYSMENGHIITDGLQGCRTCDEAVNAALWWAQVKKQTVILDDDDGEWLVGPRGGIRRFTPRLKRKNGFNTAEK